MKKTKFLLVEGSDDKSFFQQFFESLKIDYEKEIEIIEMKTKYTKTVEWKERLNAIKEKFKEENNILGIIVDSDNKLEKTIKDIQAAFNELDIKETIENQKFIKINENLKIGLFICEPRDLESLCLNIIKENSPSELKEIQDFLDKKKQKHKKIYHEEKKDLQAYLTYKQFIEEKSEFQLFLATQYNYKFAYSPGTASQKGYIKFDLFKDLKKFLENFRS